MSDADERREALAAELSTARAEGYRVARHGGPTPARDPVYDPPGPYDGPYGRALADVRRMGQES